MVKRFYNSNEAKEYRRIIKSGDSFVISIPKQWIFYKAFLERLPFNQLYCKGT